MERSNHHLDDVGLKKTTKSLRIIGVTFEIRTEYFPNTSL
jgi:hypothetical protein